MVDGNNDNTEHLDRNIGDLQVKHPTESAMREATGRCCVEVVFLIPYCADVLRISALRLDD